MAVRIVQLGSERQKNEGLRIGTGAKHDIALLAALSHDADFSVGCYCDDESHCHRSILRELLAEAGASMHNP